MVWRIDDPQGDEAGKVKWDVVRYTRGKVLDMGCGPRRAFNHFIGVDSCKDTELFGIEIQPGVKCDVGDPAAIAATFNEASVDAVFSSHCLEHIEDYRAALRAWWSLIKVGGYLVLYLPHADLYPHRGEFGANPDHKHDFYPEDISSAMTKIGCWDLLVDERRDAGMEYSFLQVYKKLPDGTACDFSCDRPKPAKTACIVRYGAIGDMVQAAGIAAALKRDGYHVTMLCEPGPAKVIEHDPNIDEVVLQDKDQLQNHELGPYWASIRKYYDKWVNLCESVEGSLLALPGRMSHQWPYAMRQKYLGHNYLEFMAELAEVQQPFCEHHFYPSEDEESRARAVVEECGNRLNPGWTIGQVYRRPFVVLWALSGSSVHKFWPHQDEVIERILREIPNAFVVLVGDDACRILEAGWEDNPRVLCRSGELKLRDTLALAQQAALVIGPETGVLNSVAFESNAKIVLLSHSSANNLTKHWANTFSATPQDTPCYPCHQLHFGHEFCPEHEESGASICQWNISADRVWSMVQQAHDDWRSASMLRSAA